MKVYLQGKMAREMKPIYTWLNKNQDIGILLLRLFVGIRLVYGVTDNVLSWEHMKQFEGFLRANGFPLPLYSAVVSVYSQLIAGLMIVFGFHIRIAALLMIVNFSIAIVMVHLNDTFEGMTPALAMLFGNIVFLFHGPGRYSTIQD